ncbi:MAG: hypothetical protein KGO82_09755 [Bacteroidota bacterium]|nr:hypothetical protein [Bacteroidota bacterium]
MGNSNKADNKSRRDFLSMFATLAGQHKGETIKLLTPDGQLVEVDKRIVDAASNRTKAGNAEILQWMDNPSKKEE